MGNVRPRIARAGPLARRIASVVKVHHLVVAGTSNWGAYGIVAELSALAGRPLLHSADEERKRAQEGAQRQVAELQKQAPVMVDYTLYFEDWQPVDGVQFPRKIRRASGGATTEEWTINKVRINPTIDPKKFAVKS